MYDLAEQWKKEGRKEKRKGERKKERKKGGIKKMIIRIKQSLMDYQLSQAHPLVDLFILLFKFKTYLLINSNDVYAT